MWLLGLASLGWADCRLVTLEEKLAESRAAFASLELDTFSGAVLEVDRALRCSEEVLTTAHASAVHEVTALRRFTDQNLVSSDASPQLRAQTAAAFRSAVVSDDGYQGPSGLAPVGNSLHQQYQQALLALTRQAPQEPLPLPRLRGAYFAVDGVAAQERPSDRPVVLQWVAEDASVEQTAYLWPEQPLPAWELPLANQWIRPTVRASAAGSAAAAVGLWGAALLSRRSLLQIGSDLDGAGLTAAQLERRRQRVNRLGVGAQVATGLSAGLGIGVVILR